MLETCAMFWTTTVEVHGCAGHSLTMRAQFEVDDTILNRVSLTPAAAVLLSGPAVEASASAVDAGAAWIQQQKR